MNPLVLPRGDPGALHAAAAALARLAEPVAHARAGAAAEHGHLAAGWRGPAADATRDGLAGLRDLLSPGPDALRRAAAALHRYADALAAARDTVRTLQGRLDDATQDAAARLRGLERTLDAGTEAGRAGLARGRRAVAADLADIERAVDRAHTAALDGLAAAQQAVVAALRDAAGALGPVRGESPSALADRVRELVLGRLPVLREHPDWVRSAVWAAGSGLPGLPGPVWRAVQWERAWHLGRAGADLPGLGLSLDAPTALNSPLLRRVVESSLGARAVDVLTHPVLAGTAPGESLLAGSLRTLPARAGLARGLGVAGGVVSVGADLVDLAAQGNPVEAFSRHGADYVADVTRTGFDVSLTALMVAPTPWTAGAVVVTGVAYGAAELVAHRDDVEALWHETGEVVGDAWDAAGDVLSDAGGAVSSLASSLNPFD